MRGEQLDSAQVDEHGVFGDRAFALIDAQTGKVASAKDPRRWPNLFNFQAGFVGDILQRAALPPAVITFPSGEIVTTDRPDIESRLSATVGREVRLAKVPMQGATAEGYWPDHEWLAHRNEVFEYLLPPGTFFDGAPIHLLTTATLDHLNSLALDCHFEVPRFRPNFVIESTDQPMGFVENGWIGRTLALGDVRLRVERPCPRCVMTTLAQGLLHKEPGVLRAAVLENGGNVGVYASVTQSGYIQKGADIELL